MLAPTIHRLLHIIHLTQENRAKHAAEAKHPER
jgi:hypothetical protein